MMPNTFAMFKALMFLDSTGRVTVPRLAPRALPKVLFSFKTTGSASITCQRFRGILKCLLNRGG